MYFFRKKERKKANVIRCNADLMENKKVFSLCTIVNVWTLISSTWTTKKLFWHKQDITVVFKNDEIK